ncbi:GNAT family N-acetyltransferase [Paenibacillus flagellatus]|uniref:GNAT family N-acetyltransferase n=1 Tax=Paenibacillus flagellatus TaxID=2211139 RepID=A0A2V5K970_9BACL|nr:GNAT family N-acetyltransferase [Paenibacillus flagellatus]PYI54644.1 GNAT family N-acetyltransferase [Paenibacillus flagellatus]
MTKPDYIVRPATIEDTDRLAELFDAYRVFYGKPSDAEGARQFLRERMTMRDSIVFAAEREAEGRLVGFAQLYPTYSSISMKRALILNDLYVAEQCRGGGVATALLDRAKKYALAIGAKGIGLETGADNVRAQRLYENNGYVRDTSFYHYEWTAKPEA